MHYFILILKIVIHIVSLIIACCLAVLFCLNTLIDFLRYLVHSLTGGIIELTPRQKFLLGVKDSGIDYWKVSLMFISGIDLLHD